MPPKAKDKAGSHKGSKKRGSTKSAKSGKSGKSSMQSKSGVPYKVTKSKTKPKRNTTRTAKRQPKGEKPCKDCVLSQTVKSKQAADHRVAGIRAMMQTKDSAVSDQRFSGAATAIDTPEPQIKLAVRSRSSSSVSQIPASTILPAPTPAYLRQLRVAAQIPPLGATSPVPDSERNDTSLAPRRPLHSSGHYRSNSPEHYLPNSIAKISTPYHTQSRIDSPITDVTVTSTGPELVASSEEFNDYRVTVTCRVPAKRNVGAPHISVTWLLPEPTGVPNEDSDSDDEPLIRRVAAREANCLRNRTKTTHCAPQSALFPIMSIASHNAGDGSPTAPRQTLHWQEAEVTGPRAAAARPRAPSRHRNPPPWARTPSAWVAGRRSTSRTAAPRPRTPAPRTCTPFTSTTAQRKSAWNKAMTKMLSYNERRVLFPRRQAFSSPVAEPGVTLQRLEEYWKHLSDLIADGNLFARRLFEHWEDGDRCTRAVNKRVERVGDGGVFGREEGDAVLRELGRRRVIWWAGGKVMLSRDALSTRKS